MTLGYTEMNYFTEKHYYRNTHVLLKIMSEDGIYGLYKGYAFSIAKYSGDLFFWVLIMNQLSYFNISFL